MAIKSETLELLEWQRLCGHLSTFAATKLGAIASRQLKIPSTKEESCQLLCQTEEIYNLEAGIDSGWTFTGIEDIGASLERAELGGMLSGEELLAIATTLAGVRRLRRVIDGEEKENLPTLQELVAQVRTYPELEREIHRCIEDDGNIAERASEKLSNIRSQLKQVRRKIQQTLQGIMQRQGNALQELTITQRSDRFVLPVKAPQKAEIPGILHDTSSTGATLYIEPRQIVELGNKLKQYRRQEKTEEEAILRGLTGQIGSVQEDLERVLAVATALDLATAKARYSWWLGANRPRFIDLEGEETITLRQLRHPLLVWQQKHEEGTEVVPINLLIEPKIRVVAITGPNTGGKTVTLKTFGLAALMAKAGIFVPAKEPVELPWFDLVLADIGDEQSLQQSLSTFSGHVRRIGRIMTALDGSLTSLVLLDEVGAGTDPAEGSALAVALLKQLAQGARLTIATTHYGELKALKYQDDRFENASVEFDDRTLKPTYRLLWGIPGRSNALTIARRLGLDATIVEEAQKLVGGYGEEVNEVIAQLEVQRREQESKAKEAGKLLQETERFYTEVSEKASSLQERERNLRLSQEKAVQEAIAAAKAEIATVIRELQQGSQTAQKAQKATAALKKIAEKHLPEPEKPKPLPPNYQPQVGEKVRVPRLNQTAEIISIGDRSGQLTVRFGMAKMSVLLTDIESLDGKKVEVAPKKQQKVAVAAAPKGEKKTVPTVRTSQNTIDLRGSRVADGEMVVDRAIAQGSAEGGLVLWIIHGKGTGKLRQGVHEFLKQHRQVERFELAGDKDGGSGVTVVYLK